MAVGDCNGGASGCERSLCLGQVRQSAEAKLTAWLSLHLQGRLLPKLLPLALPGGDAAKYDQYQFFLGEIVAGMTSMTSMTSTSSSWGRL